MGPLGQPQTQPPPSQVVALGVPSPPFPGNPLDPPLRSRFQARHVARAPAVPWPQVFFFGAWKAMFFFLGGCCWHIETQIFSSLETYFFFGNPDLYRFIATPENDRKVGHLEKRKQDLYHHGNIFRSFFFSSRGGHRIWSYIHTDHIFIWYRHVSPFIEFLANEF